MHNVANVAEKQGRNLIMHNALFLSYYSERL